MPTDTVPQWVEHRRDEPWAWVQILASDMFLFFPLHSFLQCYPDEAMEGQISTGVCKNSTMLTQIMTDKYIKNYSIYIVQKMEAP